MVGDRVEKVEDAFVHHTHDLGGGHRLPDVGNDELRLRLHRFTVDVHSRGPDQLPEPARITPDVTPPPIVRLATASSSTDWSELVTASGRTPSGGSGIHRAPRSGEQWWCSCSIQYLC